MNDDLISRQAAIEAMRELPHEYNTKEQRARTGGIAACQTIIRELPSVQPKTGRWINISPLLTAARCSECKSAFAERTNYCSHCGARMESEDNENG